MKNGRPCIIDLTVTLTMKKYGFDQATYSD